MTEIPKEGIVYWQDLRAALRQSVLPPEVAQSILFAEGFLEDKKAPGWRVAVEWAHLQHRETAR